MGAYAHILERVKILIERVKIERVQILIENVCLGTERVKILIENEKENGCLGASAANAAALQGDRALLHAPVLRVC
jgi:hypothetical protein